MVPSHSVVGFGVGGSDYFIPLVAGDADHWGVNEDRLASDFCFEEEETVWGSGAGLPIMCHPSMHCFKPKTKPNKLRKRFLSPPHLPKEIQIRKSYFRKGTLA